MTILFLHWNSIVFRTVVYGNFFPQGHTLLHLSGYLWAQHLWIIVHLFSIGQQLLLGRLVLMTTMLFQCLHLVPQRPWLVAARVSPRVYCWTISLWCRRGSRSLSQLFETTGHRGQTCTTYHLRSCTFYLLWGAKPLAEWEFDALTTQPHVYW